MSKKKDDSIILSPKYGVNPTMTVCFFCGEEKGEIALMGRIWQKDANGKKVKGSDLEAPKYALLDYAPCNKCKEKFEKDITFIEVVDSNDSNYPEISKGVSPTGDYCVVKESAYDTEFVKILDKEVFDNVKKRRICLLEKDAYELLFKKHD